MTFPYEHKRLSDVSYDGKNYMYSLICDYEDYVNSYGFISIDRFIQKWNCMNRQTFESLKPGDTFYLPSGVLYRALDYAYESDDEDCLYVECVQDGLDDSQAEILSSGDVYVAPIVHDDIRWKKKIKRKDGEKLCPILITKTKQLQN